MFLSPALAVDPNSTIPPLSLALASLSYNNACFCVACVLSTTSCKFILVLFRLSFASEEAVRAGVRLPGCAHHDSFSHSGRTFSCSIPPFISRTHIHSACHGSSSQSPQRTMARRVHAHDRRTRDLGSGADHVGSQPCRHLFLPVRTRRRHRSNHSCVASVVSFSLSLSLSLFP